MLEAEEDDDREEADADEGIAPFPGAVSEEIDPCKQQNDHPGVDEIFVDLLNPGHDRRRRLGELRRDREEERVAEGRAEGEHDRQDVQEQRNLVSRVDNRRQHRAKTYPLATTE